MVLGKRLEYGLLKCSIYAGCVIAVFPSAKD